MSLHIWTCDSSLEELQQQQLHLNAVIKELVVNIDQVQDQLGQHQQLISITKIISCCCSKKPGFVLLSRAPQKGSLLSLAEPDKFEKGANGVEDSNDENDEAKVIQIWEEMDLCCC